MTEIVLFHNPRCSKSRRALELLEERGVHPNIVEYLKTPPDEQTLRDVLRKLGLRPKDIVRRGEAAFAARGLNEHLEDDEFLLRALVAEPVLIERPIVIAGDRACIGRPPERVLDVLG